MRICGTRTALVALAAALGGFAPVTANSETPSLEGSAWVLTALGERTLVGGHPITLRFEDGRLGGSDGCNRYSSRYVSDGAQMSLQPAGAATMMACEPAVMEQARAYAAALTSTRGYRIVDGQLLLIDGDGGTLASFAPQSQAVENTSWHATGINNGKGAVASLVRGTTVTLAFDAGGRASGSSGCNNFTAGYETKGSNLRFTAPVATRRMCAGEGVMEQEAAFLVALQSVDTMRIEGNRLELRRADGALAISLARDEKNR